VNTVDDPFEQFALSVGFAGRRAVISVVGELGLLTADELGAIVDAVIDRGHRSVVLNLVEMDSIGASGLRVIAAGGNRLAAAGGKLSVRTPSVDIRLILERPEWAALVLVEQTSPDGGRLGPEQSTDLPVEHATLSTFDRATFDRATFDWPHGQPGNRHAPSDREMLDGTMRMVVALVSAAVGGADGVSVSLLRDGCLTTVAATDQVISDMDADQYETGEGPCIDAALEGRWFHIASLAAESRWPAFTPMAVALGIKAILSSPLMSAGRPVGSLNIYSEAADAFAPKDQELASLFAAEASIMLTTAGV
jgi:anti-anti-sigma factor